MVVECPQRRILVLEKPPFFFVFSLWVGFVGMMETREKKSINFKHHLAVVWYGVWLRVQAF